MTDIEVDSHNLKKLQKHIFSLSEEKEDWDVACNEWEFVRDEFIEFGDRCPCRVIIHYREHIRNLINGNMTFVGSTCVKKFRNRKLISEMDYAVNTRNKGECAFCGEVTGRKLYISDKLEYKTIYAHKGCYKKKIGRPYQELREKDNVVYGRILENLVEFDDRMNDWERNFFRDIGDKMAKYGLTVKQKECISRMAKKFGIIIDNDIKPNQIPKAKKLLLGGINKKTGAYTHPSIALKTEHYACPDCDRELVLKQGTEVVHHFAHKSNAGCAYHECPSESQIHKDGKLLVKYLIENKVVYILRRCSKCKDEYEWAILKPSKKSFVVLEHRFNFNGNRTADVAFLSRTNKIKYIFEVCHTHKTDKNARPEPWFEFDALMLLSVSYKNECINLECMRKGWLCEECSKLEIIKEKKPCRGKCFDQTGSNTYNQLKCKEGCKLIKCSNFVICKFEGPEWYLDCHGGECSQCAIFGKKSNKLL